MIAIKSLFFRNVLKVSSGTFVAQVLMLIGMPIITRLYSKDVIGVYALFISTIGITTSFVTLAYDTTIVLPKKNKDANALLKIALSFAFLLSLIILMVLYLPLDFFKEYTSIAYFIAIGTFFQVCVNSLGYFKIRNDLYSQLSKSKVLRNFILLIVQVGLYYISGIYGLLFGYLIASIATILYLIYKDDFIIKGLFKKQKREIIHKNLIAYKEYPKYFCWSNLILALSGGLPILIFNEYYSLSQIAVYSIAASIIIQPASLISSSIRPVLLSKLAQKKNKNESILAIYNKGFYLLLITGIILSIGIYFLLPSIVVFIFGKEWVESGELIKVLIPVFIWYFVSIPSSISLKVYPFQKYAFFYSIISLAIKALALFSGAIFDLALNNVVFIFCSVSLAISLLNHFIVQKKILIFEKLIFTNAK